MAVLEVLRHFPPFCRDIQSSDQLLPALVYGQYLADNDSALLRVAAFRKAGVIFIHWCHLLQDPAPHAPGALTCAMTHVEESIPCRAATIQVRL